MAEPVVETFKDAIENLRKTQKETLDNSKEKKKDGYIASEATFLRALRNIAQLVSYHKGEKKHWENAADLMSMLGVSIKVFDLKMHGHIFDTWENHTKH